MSRTGKVVLIISGVLLAVVLVIGLVVGLFIWSLRDTAPEIANNSVLVLKIEGSMPDYAPEDPFAARFLGREDRSLTNLLTQIKKAKADKRISAILLDIDLTGAGWAKADEIRDAIADFRTSGKPIYAYMEYGTNKEYYIATACERIYVAPIGDLFIVGLAADVMSLRGALDKLGIYPDFEHVGKYKSAPEQYTNKQMSKEHKEVLDDILNSTYERYVSGIAAARHKSVDEVKAMIDNAPVRAAEAQQLGLIDEAKYRDEVENDLKKRLGYKDDDKLNTVKASDYRRVTPESLGLNQGDRIAIIYASGAIASGTSSDGGPFGGESMVGSDTVVKALMDARDDSSIKAIILRVDSPGGTSYASDIIWHAVEAAKQKKPVVVSMSDLAASGGYYISTGANRIVAEPSTLTGSIGVFAGKPVLKGFYDWIGVNDEYVLRGKNAGLFRETEKFTDDERAKFKAMLENFYWQDFVPKVAAGRKRDPQYIDSIGQGRVWSGTEGKENGLVDEIGGLDHAIEVAKQLANIPAAHGIHRVVLPHPRTFLSQFFSTNDEDSSMSIQAAQQRAATEALPADMRRALRYAAILDRMQRGEIMAMLPYDVEIK
jgi:protease IV